jgi:HD-GYP domain-containing protein (c-di-GMP phosphodiesterase class II)
VLATRLSEAAGLDGAERDAAWWTALLHSAGCTSDAHEAALLYGDDIAPRAAAALMDAGRPPEVARFLASHVGGGRPPVRRAAAVAVGLVAGRSRAKATFAAHCEVAERLAGRMGVDDAVRDALGCVFERWDGKGFPAGVRGEAIPVPARVLHLARDAAALCADAGADEALAAVAARSGGAYAPELAQAFAAGGRAWLAELDEADLWSTALGAQPGGGPELDGDELDAACLAVADFADLKTVWTRGHSRGVADLAEAAAWRLDLGADAVAQLRRAALLHDLGRAGVSNAVWEKPGPLTAGEWERVRLHPYFTERALSRCGGLAALGELGASHHERVDGSGYPRRATAAQLPAAACVLAAADAYHAMTEDRPHRAARTGAAAAAELRAMPLDPDAREAVLAAAGQAEGRPRAAWPAGLTDREVEVLRLLARGLSNKLIAARLGVSPKTAGNHVQHVYEKAGVRTRAAATLFAMEHGLLKP